MSDRAHYVLMCNQSGSTVWLCGTKETFISSCSARQTLSRQDTCWYEPLQNFRFFTVTFLSS